MWFWWSDLGFFRALRITSPLISVQQEIPTTVPNLNTTSLQWIADLSPKSSLLEWAASYGFLMVSPKTVAGRNRHR